MLVRGGGTNKMIFFFREKKFLNVGIWITTYEKYIRCLENLIFEKNYEFFVKKGSYY